MALSAVATLEEALKELYLDPITKTINEQSGPVLAAIEKNSDNIVGNDIIWALQYGRHGGIGARGEMDNLPEASPRQYKQGKCNPKNLFARISFTEKLMKLSKNNKAVFVDTVATQMTDITADARDMMRRNIMGKSDGIMGTVATASTNKEVVVSGNIKTFYVGQVIDIFTLSGTTQTKSVNAKPIVDVDYANNKIVFASNVSAASGAYISLAGNYNNELIGLGDVMTENNTIYGIDRSANKWYNPQVYNKTEGTAFSSMYLQEAIDDIDDFSASKPNFIACDAGIQRAYITEQNTYKRNLEYKDVDGGYKTIAYNDVAISKEKYAPENTIFLLNTEHFTLAQLADWEWMDADGSILTRIADKAAYEAALTKYCELICKMPSAQAKITGIQEV